MIAEHGKKVIAGGALNGQTFENIDLERLRKVAKRYKADPSFQKFARACVALHEFSPEDDPRPCVPVLVPLARESSDGNSLSALGWKQKMFKILGVAQQCLVQSKMGCLIVFLLLLAFLLKPSVSTIIARTMVTAGRLIFRRFVQIISLVFDGMVDEIVYQLEYAAVDFLPPGTDVPKVAKASFNFAAHVLSGIVGASLAVLLGRRTPIQA